MMISRGTYKVANRFVAAVTLSMVAVASLAAQPTAPPDFTGVWTNPGRAAMGGSRAAATPMVPPPLVPEAKARVDAYQKLVAKGGDTPGGFCLGSRHAGLDAGLRRLPHGDLPAAGADHGGLRSPQ